MHASPPPSRTLSLSSHSTDWPAAAEAASDAQLWEDEWDDTAAGDDFLRNLRAELEKSGTLPPVPPHVVPGFPPQKQG